MGTLLTANQAVPSPSFKGMVRNRSLPHTQQLQVWFIGHVKNMTKLRVVLEPLQLRLKLLDDSHRVTHIALALYLAFLGELGVLEV